MDFQMLSSPLGIQIQQYTWSQAILYAVKVWLPGVKFETVLNQQREALENTLSSCAIRKY